MTTVTERFLQYVQIHTTSDDESSTCPSTAVQLDLAKVLVKELEELGLENIRFDEKGYVYGKLPANTPDSIQTIGFIAHMDTSPDMTGANVKPRIVKEYDGREIVLNEELNVVLSPADFPEISAYQGQDIIVTDGTTLLGADDKAGIAEILTAIEYLQANPDIKHGDIMVGFTPDEEVGRGADHFDVKNFGADFAYTIDGGIIGELQYENFNAASAKIWIKGRNVHPGTARNKMINSITAGMELAALLPTAQKPELTEDYEGFFHLFKFNGTVEATYMEYIIRDHSKKKFEDKKQLLQSAVEYMNKTHGYEACRLEITDSYYNMKEKVEPVKHIIDLAREAMTHSGVSPIVEPIRGGTDGARLSYMGLVCPNIFTGGHNFHGKFEYIPIQSMEKAVEVIVKIVELAASSS